MRDELWILPLDFVLQLLDVLDEICRFESQLRVVVDANQRLWVERISHVDAIKLDFDGQLLQHLEWIINEKVQREANYLKTYSHQVEHEPVLRQASFVGIVLRALRILDQQFADVLENLIASVFVQDENVEQIVQLCTDEVELVLQI